MYSSSTFPPPSQANDDAKVSVNDFIIRAAALALRRVPAVNSNWINGEARSLETVDVSIAVATPTGLITPIVTNADKRNILDISSTVQVETVCISYPQEITKVAPCLCMWIYFHPSLIFLNHVLQALAERAKNNKLQLHEFQGGSFSCVSCIYASLCV